MKLIEWLLSEDWSWGGKSFNIMLEVIVFSIQIDACIYM